MIKFVSELLQVGSFLQCTPVSSRNVPDEGYSRNVPDEVYSRNIPDEGYSRKYLILFQKRTR
jgi:hypothetical protein